MVVCRPCDMPSLIFVDLSAAYDKLPGLLRRLEVTFRVSGALPIGSSSRTLQIVHNRPKCAESQDSSSYPSPRSVCSTVWRTAEVSAWTCTVTVQSVCTRSIFRWLKAWFITTPIHWIATSRFTAHGVNPARCMRFLHQSRSACVHECCCQLDEVKSKPKLFDR